jgi:hypothetical protein
MAIVHQPKYWTDQPPAGVQIDFGHPLARGLTFYTLFNAGAGLQRALLPAALPATVVTGGTEPNQSWISADAARSHRWEGNWGIWYERGVWVEPNWVSAVCRAKQTGTEGGDASIYRKAYQNAANPPFVSHGINWNPASAGQQVVGAYVADQGGTLHAPNFTATPSLKNAHTYGLSVGPSGADGVAKIYLDGIVGVSSTITGMTGIKYDTTSTGRLIVSGAESTANVVPILGNVYYLGIWNRPLNASEMQWLSIEPYSFLVPQKRKKFFLPAAGRAFTFNVAAEKII